MDIDEQRVVVTLDKRAHNPILAETGLLDRPTRMPWFYGRELVLRLK